MNKTAERKRLVRLFRFSCRPFWQVRSERENELFHYVVSPSGEIQFNPSLAEINKFLKSSHIFSLFRFSK